MIRINMFQGRLLCVSVWCEWSLVALYTDQDSKFLDSIVCFAEVVLTSFWSVYAEQDASYTRNPTIFNEISLVAGLIISSVKHLMVQVLFWKIEKKTVGCWPGLLQIILQEIMIKKILDHQTLGWWDNRPTNTASQCIILKIIGFVLSTTKTGQKVSKGTKLNM